MFSGLSIIVMLSMYICSLAPWTINIAFMPFGKYYWPVKVILQVFL